MARSNDLPDFSSPPLQEVVLGVQFDPPQGYQQIRAGEVWAEFRDAFPIVQELPPLAPSFETFGLLQSPQLSIGFSNNAPHNRYWFISEKNDELIQFQNDRMLRNWRKISDKSEDYPRFDVLINKFRTDLECLERYVSGLQQQTLVIRQCELSYINHIRGSSGKKMDPSDWLTVMSVPGAPPEDFACSFRRIILSEKGYPQGRLTCEGATAVESTMQHFISLTLTARAAPEKSDMQSAIDFLHRGRDMIVRLFAEVTTDSAHRTWGRTR